MGNSLRRVAANTVVSPSGTIENGVVEVADGIVTQCYKLDGEQADTEWLQGTIRLDTDQEGRLRARYKGKLIK